MPTADALTCSNARVTVLFADTHFHGRRQPLLKSLVREKARRVCFGIAEPNTNPHLTDYDGVRRYLDEMYEAAPTSKWVASIYLTSEPKVADIERLHREGLIAHVKAYPPHGSTHTAESVDADTMLDRNSQAGKLLSAMEDWGLPLKRHAEVAHHHGEAVDAYRREKLDLRKYQPRFIDTYPKLKMILAHLSTKEGVQHMEENGDPLRYVCELTPHHGVVDRRILYDGGAIIPDHHCLPVVKSRKHLRAIQRMLRKKPPWVVAGSDAAAHLTNAKYSFLGFGGYYVYHCDLELYVQMLAELGILDYADAFLYGNAKTFFGDLMPSEGMKPVTLVKKPWTVDERQNVFDTNMEKIGQVTPFGYHPDPAKRFQFTYQLEN